ncbi:MAG: tyrosine-type recombinase/integrase [Actinomycetota bacterium]|nr:tyrosine-type recombinase/integrase [Actinomycetota bacterium]
MLTYPTVTSITVDPPLSPHKLQSLSRTRRREMPTSIATRTPPHTAFADTSRSFISHMTEDGVDPRFLQEISGHRFASTTGIYTHVTGEFMNKMLTDALGRVSSFGEGHQ